jgi:hypothetical protein
MIHAGEQEAMQIHEVPRDLKGSDLTRPSLEQHDPAYHARQQQSAFRGL